VAEITAGPGAPFSSSHSDEARLEVSTPSAGMARRQWTVVFLLVASVIVNYVDRSNLSIAAPLIQRQFSLSPLQIGTLLSAFFWTYALMQLFGLAGWLSDRLPVGWVMLGGYSLWSCATMLTGFTSSFTTLFMSLLLLGVGESVAYPCYSRIFAELPQQKRGQANAFIDAGTKLGPAMGALAGGLILAHVGWRMLFILAGAGGLVWILPWLRVMPRPVPAQSSEDAPPLPSFGRLLRIRSAWGTYLGHFCGNYFFYFLLSWLPIYLVREEKMTVTAMSRSVAAVFLLIAMATIATGWLSDHLIARGLSPTRVRRSIVVAGLATASSLSALAFLPGHSVVSHSILIIASIGYGVEASNHFAISQTLAGPEMAGRWTSIQNGFANLAGIVAPWLAGMIVQLTGSSRLTFLATGLVALAGSVCWATLVQRVEPVIWDAGAAAEVPSNPAPTAGA
jgi:ACS family D-galactonate transporter-like MFS transporter